jgi:non-specific serine/threonine protein kinase
MLETVREYGLERLAASGDEAAIRDRHAAWCLALAEAAEPELLGPEQVGWLDRLEVEHPNLRAALVWMTVHDPDLALRLSGALPQFWRIHGHLSEGRDALERALAAGEGTPAARAKALVALALVQYSQGDFAAGAALAEEARGAFEHLGDRRGVATAVRAIGYCHVGLGVAAVPPDQVQFTRAQAAFDEELGLWQALGDRSGVAWAIYSLGFLALNRGDATRAVERLEEALTLFEAVGDRWGTGWSLTSLGRVAARRADDARAAALFGGALVVLRELGDRWATVLVLEYVAWLAVRVGRAAAAARLFGTANALREADGVRLSPVHRADHEPAVAAARAALGEEGFAAAWAAGGALPLAGAVAEAVAVVETVAVPAPPPGPAAAAGLTGREGEVLRLLAKGLTDREIAAALSISPRTVGVHVTHILAKLGLESRAAAAALAVRRGLA